MTRIALVAHWDWVLFNYRLPLVRALREHGAEVILVSPSGTYSEDLALEADRWIAWDIDRPGVNPIMEMRSVAALTKIYRDLAPDLVQHYGLKPNLYGSIAAKRAKVSRVVNTYTGLGYLFSDDPRARRLRRGVFPLLRAIRRWAHPWSVALTPDDRAILEDARLVDPDLTVVLPEGIDATIYRPAEGGGKDSEPVVFMAGRLLWDKGIAELVNAAESLHSRGIGARFIVAGEPDPGNPATVPASQIASWGAGGHVEFLGQRGDVPQLLRTSDVAVLPSYHEGLPRFLLEAAATGRAIVASDIPGCRAVVEDQKSALLVEPRNVAALAAALERVVADPELRRRLGAAARVRVVEAFDERAVVERHLELYRRLGLDLSHG